VTDLWKRTCYTRHMCTYIDVARWRDSYENTYLISRSYVCADKMAIFCNIRRYILPESMISPSILWIDSIWNLIWPLKRSLLKMNLCMASIHNMLKCDYFLVGYICDTLLLFISGVVWSVVLARHTLGKIMGKFRGRNQYFPKMFSKWVFFLNIGE